MNVQKIKTQIKNYSTDPEYLWLKFPKCAVFHHTDNRKWFAVLMNISANKIVLNNTDKIWLLNIKSHHEEIGSLRMIEGIYPDYRMNKEHWLSLDIMKINKDLL